MGEEEQVGLPLTAVPLLVTDRLLLIPLTRRLMVKRMEQERFSTTEGSVEVIVGPEWPGDPFPAFPAWVAALAADEDEVAETYVAVTRDTGEAVGMLGAKGPPNADGEREIGYGINPSAWGRGYGTEAVGALVARLLDQQAVRVVTALTAVDNPASQRVLEKLGFTRTGTTWNEEDGALIAWSRSGTRPAG